MTLLGQSQLETHRPIGPIVAPRHQTSIGCWNVRTMAEMAKTAQVLKEMKDYGFKLLGISETRWKRMCGSRKYPYHPPWKVTGNSEGEGGSKAEISKGSGGFIGNSFSRG